MMDPEDGELADVLDPAPGSPEDIAIRLATRRDVGMDGDALLGDTSDGLDLDGSLAEAVQDLAGRRGPDEDDAEAWVHEVQGE